MSALLTTARPPLPPSKDDLGLPRDELDILFANPHTTDPRWSELGRRLARLTRIDDTEDEFHQKAFGDRKPT